MKNFYWQTTTIDGKLVLFARDTGEKISFGRRSLVRSSSFSPSFWPPAPESLCYEYVTYWPSSHHRFVVFGGGIIIINSWGDGDTVLLRFFVSMSKLYSCCVDVSRATRHTVDNVCAKRAAQVHILSGGNINCDQIYVSDGQFDGWMNDWWTGLVDITDWRLW